MISEVELTQQVYFIMLLGNRDVCAYLFPSNFKIESYIQKTFMSAILKKPIILFH